MFFGSKSKRLPLSAYGKLALSREFLSVGCKEGTARGFSDFLHEMARHASDIPPGHDEPVRVYIPVDRGRSLVVASLWHSADEGGLRRFPFSLFVVCPAKRAPQRHPGFCTAFAPLHEVHTKAYQRIQTLDGVRAFEQYLHGELAEIDGPAAEDEAAQQYAANASTYKTTAWAAAMYGQDARNFLVVLWRFSRLLEASRGSLANLGRDHVGLRVPLVGSHALETQADAWLGLASQAGTLSCAPNIILGRFGPNDTASLCLFFRPLQPSDFALLAGHPVRGVFDLSLHKEPADMDGFNRFSERMRVVLTQTHPTLARLPAILEEA